MWRALMVGLVLATAARADVAAVTSQGAGRISLVDTDSGKLLREIDLPGQPAAIALHDGYIATVAVGTKTLHLLDLTGRELARLRFSGAPFGVAFAASGDLYVTDAAGQGALHRLSTPDLRLIETLPAAANPTGLDVAETGHVVVAARDADVALIYPPGCSGCAPHAVAVGHHPFGVTLHAGRAYVTNVLSDDVSVIDVEKAQEIARIPTGERPYAVAISAGRGFVTNQYDASLTVFDLQSLAVEQAIETADYPEGIAASANDRILVANWFSDLLQIFDGHSLDLLHEVEMPEGPRAFGRFVTATPAP